MTPNPALDLSGHVDGITANEKNYVRRERRDAGGNGINAARVARRLGAEVVALGLLGGASGDEIETLLAREGVDARFTRIAASTRMNVTVTDDRTRRQTRLTFPGPSVTRKEARGLLQEVKRLAAPGLLVLGGSLPKGVPGSFYGEVAKAAQKRGVEVIIDAPAPYLRAALKVPFGRLLMIKPNQVELEALVGRKLRSERALVAAARSLAGRARFVCVSLAEKGAILINGDKAWRGRAPKIRARGTVGAGDAMVGAMAAKLCRGTEPARVLDAFAWGLAAGAATAEAEGTAQGRLARIRELRRKVTISAISETIRPA